MKYSIRRLAIAAVCFLLMHMASVYLMSVVTQKDSTDPGPRQEELLREVYNNLADSKTQMLQEIQELRNHLQGTLSSTPTKKVAWVTMVTEPEYVKIGLILISSLRDVGTRYPIVVMVSKSLPMADRSALQQNGAILHEIELVDPINQNPDYKHWKGAYSKLRVYELEQYDRVVFLDSDSLAMKNPDVFLDPEAYPYDKLYGAREPCAPDHLSYYEERLAINMNSGMMILNPNKQMAAELIQKVGQRHWPNGDQELQQTYFRENNIALQLLPEVAHAYLISCLCNRFRVNDVFFHHATRNTVDNTDWRYRRHNSCEDYPLYRYNYFEAKVAYASRK